MVRSGMEYGIGGGRSDESHHYGLLELINLFDLELIVYVWRIVPSIPHVSCRLHVRRCRGVVLCDPSFLVPAECVAAEIGEFDVEGRSGFLGQFTGCLWNGMVLGNGIMALGGGRRGQQLTLTNPQTKFNGSPYLSTVSTNTLNARTCIHAITASPHAVLPSLKACSQIFLSSFPTFSSSLLSSSFPPSLYLKSLGVHLLSLHLWMKSCECFLKVVTA